MTALIDDRTDFAPEERLTELIKKIMLISLESEGFETECEISLSFVSNEEIREINKRFRGIDKPTDVLSFPQLTFEDGEEYERNENGEIILGDIIISVEKAKSQAEEYGHSLYREICFLTAHSMLHLLGYDHMEEDEEKIMFSKQDDILDIAKIGRDYQ